MTTGAPEEAMMTEVEGEEWMMGHVVVEAMMRTTPNPGSPWADLVRLNIQLQITDRDVL